MSQENVELARTWFAAYNARDADACDRLLAPNADITTVTQRAGLARVSWEPGHSSRYFDALEEAWTELQIEIDDYRDLGDRVLALGRARGIGKATGIPVDGRYAALFVIRDSLFVRMDGYRDPRQALQAAGLRE
jgi:ketosteroid isomerase-like protein